MMNNFKEFLKKSNYSFEFTYSFISLILLLPGFFLTIMYLVTKDFCTYWFLIMFINIVPLIVGVALSDVFPFLSKFSSFLIVFFQFVFNCIALFMLFFKRRTKTKYFWLCLGIIVLNFILMFFIMYVASGVEACPL